ncbi:toxin-antitoxin system YwqK family antitoxin [Sungkyunkwania multivorans]|uniref:Toxin-antitoxin system YwqK family antitoxin n=1 Tax=Sungkyunkwania multivorans TaxID=1173618 RepID=A0ABW3CW35_9FLAO
MKIFALTITLLLVSSMAFAQEIKPKFEKKGELTEATYYHDNGKIAQHGFYNSKGKLQGTWKSYDLEGKKVAIGNYDNGKKVGKWFFWNADTLKEVTYEDYTIANVSEWSKKSTVAKN